MANTLFHSNKSRRDPYWRNLPPVVPRYITTEEMLSPFRPMNFTLPNSRRSYQIRLDKWYDFDNLHPKKEELWIGDKNTQELRWTPDQFKIGPSSVSGWMKEGKDWQLNRRLMVEGKPVTELRRAQAMEKLKRVPENFYSYSNYMTSTYRLPGIPASGPLQCDPPYGVTHQHNRHGFMTFDDYY